MTAAPASILARYSTRERVALAGAGVAAIGALLVVLIGGNNANGVAGPMLVVLAGAIGAGLAVASRRVHPAITASLGAGILIVALIEAIPVARYSGDLDAFGGLIGGIARLLVIGGSIALVGATGSGAWLSQLVDRDATRPSQLVGLAALLLTIGWLALVAIGIGFAPRLVDGAAIVAACLAVGALTAAGSAPAPGRQRAYLLAGLGLAAFSALITISTLLTVGSRFGALLDSGVSSMLAYVLFLVSVVPIGIALGLLLIPLMTRPATPSAQQLPPPPPPPPPAAG